MRSETTIDNILEQENTILMDGSAGMLNTNDWYKEGICGSKTFSQIPEQELRQGIRAYNRGVELFSNPKVRTTEKVAQEMAEFERILREKLTRVTEIEAGISSRTTLGAQYIDVREARRKLFEELCSTYGRMIELARKSVFLPGDRALLEKLESAAITVAENTDAKKDFAKRNGQQRRKNKDSHADEQLVATAIYLSVAERRQNCIITGDSDLGRILTDCKHFVLKSTDPNCRVIAEQLATSPVRIYFTIADKIYLAEDTSNLVAQRVDYQGMMGPRAYNSLAVCVEAIIGCQQGSETQH